MGVTLAFSSRGTNTDWRWRRTKCWGEFEPKRECIIGGWRKLHNEESWFVDRLALSVVTVLGVRHALAWAKNLCISLCLSVCLRVAFFIRVRQPAWPGGSLLRNNVIHCPHCYNTFLRNSGKRGHCCNTCWAIMTSDHLSSKDDPRRNNGIGSH
jgi:hypothetical protein